MFRVKFTNRVKYNGVFYPAHTIFEVSDNDVDSLVSDGAIVIDSMADNSLVNTVDTDTTTNKKQTKKQLKI